MWFYDHCYKIFYQLTDSTPSCNVYSLERASVNQVILLILQASIYSSFYVCKQIPVHVGFVKGSGLAAELLNIWK